MSVQTPGWTRKSEKKKRTLFPMGIMNLARHDAASAFAASSLPSSSSSSSSRCAFFFFFSVPLRFFFTEVEEDDDDGPASASTSTETSFERRGDDLVLPCEERAGALGLRRGLTSLDNEARGGDTPGEDERTIGSLESSIVGVGASACSFLTAAGRGAGSGLITVAATATATATGLESSSLSQPA